ncbi:MAG: hypothetical protein AAFW98_06825, partial [Pseudomonadota bacterium]
PLISDRTGNVCTRDLAVAAGTVIAREDDSHPDASEIARIFERCEMDTLLTARDITAAMKENLEAIGLVWVSNAEDPPSLTFKRIAPLLAQMASAMQEALEKRDPSFAATEETEEAHEGEDAADDSATPAGPVGKVSNVADVKAALAAVRAFYERHEPSSPGYLLVRKATRLVGLTFPQVLEQIAPDKVYATHIQLGPQRAFALPMEKLSEEYSDVDLDPGDDEEPTTTFEAPDRASAIALMSEIGTWYRKNEPSNAIPLLLDRARDLMTKDFNALLNELAMPSE